MSGRKGVEIVSRQCCVEVDASLRVRRLWISERHAEVLGGLCRGECLEVAFPRPALDPHLSS